MSPRLGKCWWTLTIAASIVKHLQAPKVRTDEYSRAMLEMENRLLSKGSDLPSTMTSQNPTGKQPKPKRRANPNKTKTYEPAENPLTDTSPDFEHETHITNNPQPEPELNHENSKQQTSPVKSTLKTATLNVCGIIRRSSFPDFKQCVAQYDMLFICETKLDTYDIISITEYTFISQPRRKKYIRKSGGLGAFIHNDILKYVSCIETDSDYVLWLKVCKHFTGLQHDIVYGVT